MQSMKALANWMMHETFISLVMKLLLTIVDTSASFAGVRIIRL
jgi:hypothetical protein